MPNTTDSHRSESPVVSPDKSPGGAPLRVGLIGTGRMGLNHLRAIGGCTGVTVVGVADPLADRELLRQVLPEDAIVVDTADALFERARPEVVHIVTPPRTHGSLAIRALQAGAHVYVEKPFTLTRAETESVLAESNAQGLRVCAGHQCLYQHAAIGGRAALAELGTVVHVESYFSFRTVRRSISPVDQAKDILPHAVYMLVDLLRAARSGIEAPIALDAVQVGADGAIYGLLSLGDCRGLLIVTLTGRPVEQYAHIVGTNGSMRIDLVSDAVTRLVGPGASAIAAMTAPYRVAWQSVRRSTAGFVRQIKERKFGYPGLRTLCQHFYDAVRLRRDLPISAASILETVVICEQIGEQLDAAEIRAEQEARARLSEAERRLAPTYPQRSTVLVTGAAGFLGSLVVRELRRRGWPVRALVRQPLRNSMREPGVDYETCDLARGIPLTLMTGVGTVLHCAAETRGSKADQERNSIQATRAVLEAAAAAGVKQIVHVSSVAVLRPAPSTSGVLDESAPLDAGNLARGPYVWGKAESERIAIGLGQEHGLAVRVVRLGPLVDFAAFEAPGRLGREVGPTFVAVGPKKGRLALCGVDTAAAVLRSYVEDFAAAPAVLNLTEPDAPTRAVLVGRLKQARPDLRVRWVPFFLLRLMSPPLKWAQRLLLGSRDPIDIASAFTSPQYATGLAGQVVARARGSGSPVAEAGRPNE